MLMMHSLRTTMSLATPYGLVEFIQSSVETRVAIRHTDVNHMLCPSKTTAGQIAVTASDDVNTRTTPFQQICMVSPTHPARESIFVHSVRPGLQLAARYW